MAVPVSWVRDNGAKQSKIGWHVIYVLDMLRLWHECTLHHWSGRVWRQNSVHLRWEDRPLLHCVPRIVPQLEALFSSEFASCPQEELQASHATYVRRHPELSALLADFLQLLLLRKPEDVVTFAAEFFAPFSAQRPPGRSFQSSDKPSPFRSQT